MAQTSYKKHHLFFCLSLLIGIGAQAQLNGNKFIVQLTGSFSKEPSSNMLMQVNAYESTQKSWDAGISIGYTYNNWIYGIGFEYGSLQMEATGLAIESRSLNAEMTTTKAKAPLGKIFVGHYFPVCKNLYFSPVFYGNYGKVNTEIKSLRVNDVTSLPEVLGTTTPPGQVRSDEFKLKADAFGFQLAPEFTYFFSKHIGCKLQLGGAMMAVVDNSWSNKQTVFSFAPKYWQVGLVCGF